MPRVIVYRPSDREYWYCQWKDPVSGRKKTRSTRTTHKREADRFRARLEVELESGAVDRSARVSWEAFRRRYEAEVLASKSEITAAKEKSTLNAVEEHLSPRLLVSLDASAISRFRAKLLVLERAGYTIRGHLSALRRALTWAKDMGMIPAVPTIPAQHAVASRGRPVTAEEFERMVELVPEVVGPGSAPSWLWLLRGLWWSGLRLSEAMRLSWRDDRLLCVDLSGERPMFRFRAAGHKSRRECILPMAPEFAEMLYSVPREDRRGLVFNPRPLRKPFDVRLRTDTVSKRITAIGERAGVVVSHRGDTPKFASAHDLRRGFGFRWAHRVPAVTLQQMMRHQSIQTTQEFYLGRDAEAAADIAWASIANTMANTRSAGPVGADSAAVANPAKSTT